MVITIGRHRAQPHPGGLCWMLFEYREVKRKDGTESMEWVSMDRYPSTFMGAVGQCVEFELMEGGESGWREVIERLDALSEQIRQIDGRN